MAIIKILSVLVLIYFIILLYVYFSQEKLILFPPKQSFVYDKIPLQSKIALEVNGIKFQGIYRFNEASQEKTVIYFGGNAEDVFLNFDDFNRQLNANYFAFNYRGFVNNDTTPTLAAMLVESKILVTKIAKDFKLKPEDIVLMGRSLGSAIATNVSDNFSIEAVILVTPFDSLSNIAKKHFPYLPVDLILKQRLDSSEIAKKLDTPLLLLAAEDDTLIPVSYSRNLFNSWKSNNKKMILIENRGHNTVHSSKRYYQEINSFLSSL